MMRQAFGLVIGSLVVAACGSRGPLDDSPSDFGQDASLGLDGASPNDASANKDATPTPVDAGLPDTSPSPLACAQCVGQSCGMQVSTCLQDTACRNLLTCAAQKCAGMGGNFDPKCVAQCANNDFGAIQKAFAVIQCISGKCGNQCLALLGGLGG